MGAEKDLITPGSRSSDIDEFTSDKRTSNLGVLIRMRNKLVELVPSDKQVDTSKRNAMSIAAQVSGKLLITPGSVLNSITTKVLKEVENIISKPSTYREAQEQEMATKIYNRLHLLSNHGIIIDSWNTSELSEFENIARLVTNEAKELRRAGYGEIGGIDVDDLHRQMISNNIKWENSPSDLATISESTLNILLRYAPTSFVKDVMSIYPQTNSIFFLNSVYCHKEINPSFSNDNYWKFPSLVEVFPNADFHKEVLSKIDSHLDIGNKHSIVCINDFFSTSTYCGHDGERNLERILINIIFQSTSKENHASAMRILVTSLQMRFDYFSGNGDDVVNTWKLKCRELLDNYVSEQGLGTLNFPELEGVLELK